MPRLTARVRTVRAVIVSIAVPARDRNAPELRAIAPLVVTVTKELVGPAMLVTSGTKTVAIASTEALRSWDAKQLSIAVSLDGTQLVPVASWGLGRFGAVGLIELGAPIPPTAQVVPLDIGSVCATVDTRGAPAAMCTVTPQTTGFSRDLIPCHVDAVDAGGGMSDDILVRLATPHDPVDGQHFIDGAILFAWFPPDPVLGRKSEVLAVAMAYPYRQQTFQPRSTPAVAELVGLDDVGRAVISSNQRAADRPELHEVVGEVETK